MKGVLILAHGSRENGTIKTMDKILQMVRMKLPHTIIEAAYLQFSKVNLTAGLNRLIDKGADEITVVPYFLFDGWHIRKNIPVEIDNFIKSKPQIKIKLAKTLGADERLADILADRIDQAQ